MNARTAKRICIALLIGALQTATAQLLQAQHGNPSPSDVLTADQWSRTDVAVERGLAWLASQQQSDGSFPSLDMGQPGVTGLGVLAFMSHGHVPGSGPYGDALTLSLIHISEPTRPY